MARNIEIKARIENVALLTPKVAGIATEGPHRDRAGRHVLQLRHRPPEAARVLERLPANSFSTGE